MPLFFTTPQNMKALFRQLINKLALKNTGVKKIKPQGRTIT